MYWLTRPRLYPKAVGVLYADKHESFLRDALHELDITALCQLLLSGSVSLSADEQASVVALRDVRNLINHSSPEKHTWRTDDFRHAIETAARAHSSDLDLTAAFTTILHLAAEMRKRASTVSSSSLSPSQ